MINLRFPIVALALEATLAAAMAAQTGAPAPAHVPTHYEITLVPSDSGAHVLAEVETNWRLGSTEPIVFAMGQYGLAAFTAAAGPNGWVCDGYRVFVGNNQTDLSHSSRDYNANIKQIQLTEHR